MVVRYTSTISFSAARSFIGVFLLNLTICGNGHNIGIDNDRVENDEFLGEVI